MVVQKSPKKATRKKDTATKCAAAEATKLKPSYQKLQKVAGESAEKYRQAENTRKSYKGYIKRGREFVKSFARPAEAIEKHQEEDFVGFADSSHSTDAAEADIELDPEFPYAFDDEPKKCTPLAISLFMASKCFNVDGKSTGSATAILIHAAFKSHYKHLDEDTYRGRWRFDHHSGRFIGNPCDSSTVEDLLTACKNKDGEGDRTHSCAITVDDLVRILAFAESNCPKNPVSYAEHIERARFLMFQAFRSTAFTLWTRNCETTQLQYKHLEFSTSGRRDPLFPDGFACFRINLKNCKNWQKKAAKSDILSGNKYTIYPQDIPAIDCYNDILNWLDYYEGILGRALTSEDYIFPHISPNGSVIANRPMSAETIQEMINTAASAAGLRNAGKFTTHCFRRGGAQFRFMFAPVGKRWTLSKIRWWGGWAQGEHRDTLIRYILDELYNYEEDHSDSLCPVQADHNTSQAGEALDLKPVTREEHKEFLKAATNETRIIMRDMFYSFAQTQARWISSSQFTPPSVTSTYAAPATTTISIATAPKLNWQYTSPAASQPLASTTNGSPSFGNTRQYLVPDVRGAEGWKQIVLDWEHADLARNLHTALRDWPKEAIKDKKNAVKYGQRRMIADEYITHFKRNEKTFLEAYPAWTKGISFLLEAIRRARQLRGAAKTRNGKHSR